MVQCKKTGRWYNPQTEFNKLKTQKWFLDTMKRMADR